MAEDDHAGVFRGAGRARTVRTAFWTAFRTACRILPGLLLLAAAAVGVMLWHSFHVGDIRALRKKSPGTTAFIESARAENPEREIRWTWIPLESVPRELRRMVLVAEDAKFYSHAGFDWREIGYALVANRRSGRNVRGASTITQQTAKNLYLSGEKAVRRKLHEAVLTFLLEHYLDKDRILEIYLNIAQFGPAVFGVQEGARHHFGKNPPELTQEEMLGLAALLPAPGRWNPHNPSRRYLSHKSRVARNMGLLRGIQSGADSLEGDAPEVYDSLGVLLSEERRGDLRAVPVWELLDTAADGDSVAADSVAEGIPDTADAESSGEALEIPEAGNVDTGIMKSPETPARGGAGEGVPAE